MESEMGNVKPLINESVGCSDTESCWVLSMKEPRYNPCNLFLGKASLSKGNQGPLVAWLQSVMNAENIYYKWGLPPLTIDGVFGNSTLTYVKRFQKAKGINADGRVGYDTIRQIRPAVDQQFTDKCVTPK